ncbi:thiamine pyrophosphate binding domain-containing protein [Tolypothrix sp. NIES-4075]|uniref:ScyA-related TPP-binding enzyme n=1 Tax=Tolypothrix sp. NIES-4075 TaxID=2005459 RepID=UPI000B5CC9E4|nr:ScyA-related TPP-binding enzyme [Tolypothrix sp. NIES-4075]GAX45612.1 thiamine pyrophosphate binding domain-containing protein [Tolypothrix sp. NIES-4075]
MSAKIHTQNASTAEQLERDTDAELASSESPNSSLSKSPVRRSPLVDNQPNSCSDSMPSSSSQESAQLSVAEAVVEMLQNMGVVHAFGVSGGGVAPLWTVLERSPIQVFHFRHEAGAAFAATESYLASGRPVLVFTTTGPGLTNALTGLFAARSEGAKVILLSGYTPVAQRGRWALQETSSYTMPISGLFTSGSLFHYATILESDAELPEIARRLSIGLGQLGGFVAHISIPTGIQGSPNKISVPQVAFSRTIATVSNEAIAKCVQLLNEGPFAIWVGFGARYAAQEIRQLAEKTGAAVMCSPRSKGIFPEDHPQFIGVTGFAGHPSVLTYMQVQCPQHVLVLGTRLGEFTSFWRPDMVPSRGFIHVDIDPEVPGTAYPSAETFAIHSDVGMFVKALLEDIPKRREGSEVLSLPRPHHEIINPSPERLVRPEVLMDAIQRVIVEGSDALVMAEGGNSFAWAIHLLKFIQPDRFRISTYFASMGHFVTGVVGGALGHNGKAVAIVGDGAMLMNNEVSTAVKFRIPAVWIVLNDARYNMCDQGNTAQGLIGVDTEIPRSDFVKIATGMGACGIRVEKESGLEAALEMALASKAPFVVDIQIDPTRPAPIGGRIQGLISQRTQELQN